MSRKIYAFGYSFTVACNALEACAHLGLPPHSQVTDVTGGLKNLCESVLGADAFAPPSKPIFFGAGSPERTHMHALGACGVVTGDKEAIDEVSRLVKFEGDYSALIGQNLAEIQRLDDLCDRQVADMRRLKQQLDAANARIEEIEADHNEKSNWLHDELAAAKARVVELENAAKETNDRLVWHAERAAMALEASAPVPVTIDATPLAPLHITDTTPDADESTALDNILRRDWPADVPFATVRDTVARAGYVMNDQAIRNRAAKLGLRRTNPTAHQGSILAQTAQPLESTGITPPATPSRLAKLIWSEAIRMADEMMNPDEIAAALNATLGKNDQVNARQVTKVLAEMARLDRARREEEHQQ